MDSKLSSELSPALARQVEQAVEIMKRGGIAAYPTDTVYGLGADAFNLKAVERIYQVKQRPRNLPLPVLLAGREQVASVAAAVSEIAHPLMEHFCPGGLTLVLPRADSFPAAVAGGSDKVAVRMPDHAVPVAIIRGLGAPIIGTSANLSNKPSALTAREVEAQLGGKVDIIVDGGRCPGGLESTVVDLTSGVPLILRRGAVPEVEVQRVYRENIKKVDSNAYCSGK